MYLNRLPVLQARIHAYQVKTQNHELRWRVPVAVPTSRLSLAGEHYFSWGRFDVEDASHESSSLAVFVTNPNRKLNLNDPHGFMLILAPYGSVDDLIVIFRTHIEDKDTGSLALEDESKQIRIIKGVVPQIPGTEAEAKRFTFSLNKEIATLFFLAAREAQAEKLFNTELDLCNVMRATPNL